MNETLNNSKVADAWNAFADKARAAGDAVASGAKAASDAVVTGAKAAGGAVSTGAKAAGDAVAAAGDAVVSGAKAAGDAIVSSAKAAGDAVATGAKAAGDAVAYGGKTAIDLTAAGAARAVVGAAKASKTVEECLVGSLSSPGGKPGDGEFLGKDCPKTSKGVPAEGVKPQGCQNSGKIFPKIVYTNGINTPPQAACATIHKIADSRCAEVIGIYNATDGMLADVANANLSIEGRRTDPASIALSETVRDFSVRGEPMTLFAHSEGGLNSIVGLRDAYLKMQKTYGRTYADAAMQNISVSSFGTAQTGWPPGPRYTQYTNASDPVPHVISQAQSQSDNRALNTRLAPRTEQNRFNTPEWNPIAAHSMDGAYLDRLNAMHPVKKGPGGSCCA